MGKITAFTIALALAFSAAAAAQITQPRVTMNITLPDGSVKELSTRANSLARLKLADNREFAFRPSPLDDKGVLFTVTIFRMEPTFENMGDTEVRAGEKPVDTKTTPVFKLAIFKVQ